MYIVFIKIGYSILMIWTQTVAVCVATACVKLIEPAAVDVDTVFHSG